MRRIGGATLTYGGEMTVGVFDFIGGVREPQDMRAHGLGDFDCHMPQAAKAQDGRLVEGNQSAPVLEVHMPGSWHHVAFFGQAGQLVA